MKIFLSHAAADQELVERLLELLQIGVGVPHNEIFYSKTSIPNGELFVNRILKALDDAELVISVLSKAYFESDFCLAEAGAGLMKRAAGKGNYYSLVVPPAGFEELGGALYGVQSGKILEPRVLSELRDVVVRLALGPAPGTAIWDQRQSMFLKAAGEIVSRGENKLISERIELDDVSVIERSTDLKVDYKAKVRLVFVNNTGSTVTVGPAVWDATGDTVPLQGLLQFLPLRVQNRFGNWDAEARTVLVTSGNRFSTWLGVAASVKDSEVVRRCATRRFARLRFDALINGQTVNRVFQF